MRESHSNESHSKRVFTNDRVMTNNGDPPERRRRRRREPARVFSRLDISTPRDARERRSGMTDDRLKVSRGSEARERKERNALRTGTGSPETRETAGVTSRALNGLLVFQERGRAPSSFSTTSPPPSPLRLTALSLSLARHRSDRKTVRPRKMSARPRWPV